MQVSIPSQVDNVTLQSTGGILSIKNAGVAAAHLAPGAVTAIKQKSTNETKASGTSSSGSAGTVICSIDAGSGNALKSIRGVAYAQNFTNTQADVRATYTDAMTDTFTLAIGERAIIDSAGVTGTIGTTPTYWNAAKTIQKIEIRTAGTGTSPRYGELVAEIVTP